MWNMSHITALWSAMKPAGVGATEIRIVFWEWVVAYSIRFLGVISQLIKPIAYSRRGEWQNYHTYLYNMEDIVSYFTIKVSIKISYRAIR